MNIWFGVAIGFFLLLSAVVTLVVLIQESKSLGLGASFGGDAGESLFGTSTAAVLKKATAVLAVIFVLSCLLLSFWSSSFHPETTEPFQIEESL